MNAWLLRGIGMGLVNVIVRVLLGAAVSHFPLQGSRLRFLAAVVAILAAVVWGGIDGIRDRRRNPDPDDSADLTILWLKAAVLGGILAGALSWIAGLVTSFGLGDNTLIFELTSGAAFTILLIFIPAMIAVTIGRFLAGREAKKNGGTADAEPRRNRSRNLVAAGSSATAATTEREPDTEYRQSEYQQSEPEYQQPEYQQPEYQHAEYTDDTPTEAFEPVQQHKPSRAREESEAPTESQEQWQEPGSHRSE